MTTSTPTPEQPRVALVTGAGRRLGREIALGLARAGWDIAVHYRNSHDEAREVAQAVAALGRRAITLQCDLSDEEAVHGLLPAAVKALERVDCVVNNASLFDYDSDLNFSHARLDAHMHANVAAPIQLARALYDATPEGGQAVVVNLLDQKLYNLNPDFLSYTLSKAALQAANTMLAQSLAPKVRHHHGVGRPERGRLRQGAHPDAAGPFQHPRGHCRRRGLCGRRARDDRHYPAGRWRPAFAAVAARCDVPYKITSLKV